MMERAPSFDVFLSHSHLDAQWVELLAKRLQVECNFNIWLDKWVLVPGKGWQQEIAQGLNQAATCAICIGGKTPSGWFQQEIELALNRQAQNNNFRVIPVLLPEASIDLVDSFLQLRTWADFRKGQDEEYAFHVLMQGIKGVPIGSWPSTSSSDEDSIIQRYKRKLNDLHHMKLMGLHDEVVIEFERKILNQWFQDFDSSIKSIDFKKL